MKNWLLVVGLLVISTLLQAQIISGPMVGPTYLRNADIWVSVHPGGAKTTLEYWPVDKPQLKKAASLGAPGPGEDTNPMQQRILKFLCAPLEPATAYAYRLTHTTQARQIQQRLGSFKTPMLWQWRTDAPDVTFLAGSCNYVNEPPFDRPGKPYGLDSSIYQSMAAEKADLMLWLGDNWYTREIDYANRYGLWYRALHDRAAPILQPLLANTPNLAIWDDHDFGPNDYAFSYIHKEESRKVFNALWLNPSSGHQNQGIYTRYQLADVDFFLMDDRWWRSFDEMADSINGQPNPDKLMWGKQQLAWLKEELRISQRNRFINFRVIATGSQVLNPVSPWDRMRAFPAEYFDFINFLREEKIEGIVFLTGDRHHSEIIKVQEPGLYPLYDVTSSPLTSGTHVFDGPEKDNPYRVVGVDRFQNYARIQVTGPRNGRKLHIAFKGLKGEVLAEYAIEAAILKVPKG